MSKVHEDFGEIAASLFKGMDGYLATKTVVGSPIEINDTVILPLVNVSFGMGVGAGLSEKKNTGTGGLGGKMSPSAVLIIHNGKTRLINISTHSGLDKILDMIPDFVDKFKSDKDAETDIKPSDADEATRDKAREELSEMIVDAANE